MVFRSLLFVPGARPDRFSKAVASGADAVCIDLEDAVAPDLKAEARVQTLKWLEAPPPGAAIGLRVNALSTLDGLRDVVALAESRARSAFLMIPKPAGALEILNLRSALGRGCPPLWPLIESPEALFALPDIARAVGETGGLMLGGADYSASLGSDMSFDALHHVRAMVVAAAALVGCEAVDVPFLDVKDEAALRTETRRVKAMGFTGRAAIHPAQIAVINEVFAPTQDELTKAEKIRDAYEAATGGVALLDGKLIERPVLRAAERVLQSQRTKV
jgi:citrate lyase subunit beta/citryl-CoA lyase/(S)-citramalyl-CoA lyase